MARARCSWRRRLSAALRLLRRSNGMVQAKDMVKRYAEQARDELANLPDGPGRQALATPIYAP